MHAYVPTTATKSVDASINSCILILPFITGGKCFIRRKKQGSFVEVLAIFSTEILLALIKY